jgi:Fe-S cluster assembly protein SufB
MDARVQTERARELPSSGAGDVGSAMLAELEYDDIRDFVRASETPSRSWDDVPEDVKRTFDRLSIPEAEQMFLSGVGAQYESEVVYHQIHEDLE